MIKFLFGVAVVTGALIYGFVRLLKLQKHRAGNSWLIGKGIELEVNLQECEILSRRDTFQEDKEDDFPVMRVKDHPGAPKVPPLYTLILPTSMSIISI